MGRFPFAPAACGLLAVTCAAERAVEVQASRDLACPKWQIQAFVHDDVARADGCGKEAIYFTEDGGTEWFVESIYPLDERGLPFVPACREGEYTHFIEVRSDEKGMTVPATSSGEFSFPKRLFGRDPKYPYRASHSHQSAVFFARCKLSAVGLLDCCDLEERSGDMYAFESSVRFAMSSWRYQPSTMDGVPVDVQFVHKFVFQYFNGLPEGASEPHDAGVTLMP